MLKRIVAETMLAMLIVCILAGIFKIQPARSGGSGHLLLTTDKDSYVVGEIVTITLWNVGNETAEIWEMPPWEIYRWPFEPVYPCVFLPYVWWLGLGENRSFTWNQHNAFTGYFVDAGRYVVRDTQGWGLSAYFSIVPALIVPDDYPTIQEAVNNANEGGTIFVRNGTYSEHVLINKSLTLTGENRDGTVLNATDIDPLVIVQADNVQITQFTMQGWSFQDIIINASANAVVIGNKFFFNGVGIDFENSHNCTASDNILEGVGLDNIGIMIAQSYNCVVKRNAISGAISDGIRLWLSHDILITENNISHNDYGIFLHTSENNTVSENQIFNNGNVGIALEATSVNNTIFANTFYQNFLGVCSSSSYNLFVHNNFVNNTSQTSASPANVWDRNTEGNYWSDYNGTDSDVDGIGDAPYVIDSSNQDNYPLMNPYWSPADINRDLKVDVKDVYKTALAYGSLPGYPNWNQHCDVNEDGQVDVKDYYIVCRSFGETCP